MLKKLLAIAMLASLTFCLAACETTKGAGKDIEKAGEAIQDAAD